MTPIKAFIIMSNDELALAALSSFNNSLANNANVILASQTSSRDRKFSREMSDLAWQRNLEAWHMQNEYNLPVNQYARQLEGLLVNGLNPNLVYGSSSSVSGAAGGINPYRFDGYHSTAVPRFSGPESINSLLSTRLLQTQIAAQEANNRLVNARADNEEARFPGVLAKSEETEYRWRYLFNNPDKLQESYDGEMALKYWSGLNSQTIAQMNAKKDNMLNYDMITAQWLNETEAPGTGMTYRQLMESYKAYLPGAQYAKFKADVLDIASRIAYRAKQGSLLDLKIEYQGYVNQLAKYGRTLGNDWVNLILMGLEYLFGDGDGEKNPLFEGIKTVGDINAQGMPPTYPGP